MLRKFWLATSGLTYLTLFGLGSYAIAFGTARSAIANPGNTHHNHTGLDHKPIEIPTGQAVPSVDLIVHKDAKKGWNLEAKVANFQFAPENVNQTHKPGEGHF
jgi:hypothetical protein